jgi:hypothetical protein
MEQVVKKLNAEIRAAKLQSQELQQTHHYINSILSTEPKKESSKSGSLSHKVSPIKDIKNRFSEPPAPPPQQPLPEKPDAPSIRRTDTERPLGTSSPARPDTRITSLADALCSAKKEIEAQSVRVQDLEAMLNEERRAREVAEERANRLLLESSKDQKEADLTRAGDGQSSENAPEVEQDPTGAEDASDAPNMVDVATSRLQTRLELMMAEMSEMKQQMERYRQRAEEAEAESAMHRQTLAEMVEKIRQDDAKTADRVARRQSRSGSDHAQASPGAAVDGVEKGSDTEEGEITIINEKELDGETSDGLSQRHGLQKRLANGVASADSTKVPQTLATHQFNRNDMVMTHGAPAVSILTVVALGVAVMAWLNSYPKVER